MKKMVVIIMLACMLVFTGIANTESVAEGIEVITSLYATERATGIDNYGRHFMYLIWKDDLKRVDYTEVTDLIDKCDGWNGLNLYGNKNGIIGVFWSDENVPAFYEGTCENEKTDIREAFTIDEGELKATWVVEGASLGSADKYGAFKPVRIVWIKGETNYRLVVVDEGEKNTPKPIIPTPAPTLEPTQEPTATPAPSLEPIGKSEAATAPTASPSVTPGPKLGEKDVGTTARPELGNDEEVKNTEVPCLELKEAETLADETKMDFN